MRPSALARPFALLVLSAAACSSSGGSPCDPIAQAGCQGGKVCEFVLGGAPACFDPVVITGTVAALGAAETPVAGARVVALDEDRAPISEVATSDTAGAWTLRVRAAVRDASGAPVQSVATLRADAQGYQTFPGGLRTALPIDLAAAGSLTHDVANHRWVVSGPLTALSLVPLSGGGTAWVTGTVARPVGGVGALVVAEPSAGGTGPGTGRSAVADANGNYTIFNLDAGVAYQVRAYAKLSNYVPVATGALATGDNAAPALVRASGGSATLAGTLIFNNGAGDPVGVALVVESTYVETLDRGETPPGLAVQSAAAAYAITGVPDGRYVVLAASGLDHAVRDISGGGNTAPVQVEVAGGVVVGALPAFKVKPAVYLASIDSWAVSELPLVVTTATPNFSWYKESAYSAASTYRVKVYDAFGVEVWSLDMAAGNHNEATYAGAPLVSDMPYQLRIQAIAEAMPVPESFTVLSQTEDLLGVFTYVAPPPP